ncbi:UNVERIFIED_CONTAM: hypothetical protein DES50_10546 [Williamsia faeni]
MGLTWKWDPQSPTYGNYGNANQWTVNAGLHSLARESTQNSNDARIEAKPALDFNFIRLTGSRRDSFLNALAWEEELQPHLRAMGDEASGAVTAGNIQTGLDALANSDSMVLLAISDYGCRGLTGPEYSNIDSEDFGNFVKLCRLDLFSGKDEAAGGSFGLGKAVYWRFSSIQTVLFNSVVTESDAVAGHTQNRLIGVNQGVAHRLNDESFQGRGYFGVKDETENVASTWAPPDLVRELYVDRSDDRPGTTALLVGFYDPDEPETVQRGVTGVIEMATALRAGIEENFWPLLARRKMDVTIRVTDNDKQAFRVDVDPEDTYTELVRALRRFDDGDVDEELSGPYSVVTREIPIDVPRRKSAPTHSKFTHQAQLVVTISDDQKDTLENRVCLFRKPEMIVQTIDKSFENHTYHAFLLTGGAIHPQVEDNAARSADDFLRFAEPPAHDRWIPRAGRGKTSQSSLNAHYAPPWLPNLRKIESEILAALYEIFGAPPASDGKPPASVFKHLSFLRGEPGHGGSGSTTTAKPSVTIEKWDVRNGKWHITFQIRARNRPNGWRIAPTLFFFGLDGRSIEIPWEAISSKDAKMDGEVAILAAKDRGRFIKATLEAVSTDQLPIPAEEAAIDIALRDLSTLDGQVPNL